MNPPPFEVHHELPGWCLFWALLEQVDGSAAQLANPIAVMRRSTAERARASLKLENLPSHPTAAAIRKLFRAAGCDPTQHRPASEALLRRVLKGDELPPIHPLVDLNNCLSISMVAPSGVADEKALEPPITLRAGRPEESYESLRGPFNLSGKPLLADARGPFGSPITDSRRIMVQSETRRVWIVTYGAFGAFTFDDFRRTLDDLIATSRAARVESVGVSTD